MDRSVTAHGFRPDDLVRIRRDTFVQCVEHHRDIASTNTRALSLAEEPGLALPALVLTDLQTAGRGRGANRWWSDRGALTFSLVVPRSHVEPLSAGWTRMSLTTGLAVGEALQQLRPGLELGLKWPNDVYVRSRKIGGILVEVPPRAPDRVVVGVGVNVNNSLACAPAPVAELATSLIDVTGYAFDLTVVLVQMLRHIADELTALARADSALARRWTVFCMLTGRQVRVAAGQRITIGTCQGIDESGALQVDTAHGPQRCLSGVVTVLGGD